MKKIVTMTMMALLTATMAMAQSAKTATTEDKPKPATAKAAPEPQPLPVNIKIEVSITDQTGTNPAAKKVVTMIASDRQSANVRSSASVAVRNPRIGGGPDTYNYRNVTINVDAKPAIVAREPNKISVNFGLEYLPKSGSSQEEMEPGMTSWSERLSLVLESGKPMIISQAADPTSDRKITVEITATILR
jgi:hypothetical protein